MRSTPPAGFGPILAATGAAAGAPRADLQVTLLAGAGPAGMERVRLLDVADALAGDHRLPSAGALPVGGQEEMSLGVHEDV